MMQPQTLQTPGVDSCSPRVKISRFSVCDATIQNTGLSQKNKSVSETTGGFVTFDNTQCKLKHLYLISTVFFVSFEGHTAINHVFK